MNGRRYFCGCASADGMVWAARQASTRAGSTLGSGCLRAIAGCGVRSTIGV